MLYTYVNRFGRPKCNKKIRDISIQKQVFISLLGHSSVKRNLAGEMLSSVSEGKKQKLGKWVNL